ncbi:MAG: discoidin domain-containing protein [Bacteroidales bacterium]|jgi:hypothetical protein|nr:discoidin domain-containing protein [Bacteroidales bacterium]
MKKTIWIYFVIAFVACPCFAQQWHVINSSYPSEDAGVYRYTDTDHTGIDKTGATDSRSGIQALLTQLGAAGGGTLYLPAGRYKINGNLLIPKGVVLRGDWAQPGKNTPVTGTILMAYGGRGTEDEAQSLITMEPSTGLFDVAIWYPEQSASQITPYPPSVVYGRTGYWGNDYCNVRNVTLVNSYTGVIVSRQNGGGCPNIFNLYGTPLSRGIEIDNIADVGRFDWIDFSPDYWSASGLPGAPAKGGAHAAYIRSNATGAVMRRNDWSYTCHLTVEGYHIGFYTGKSVSNGATGDEKPNGHNYHLTFTGCGTGIHIDAIANAGIMFTKVNISDSDNGIVIGAGAASTAQFHTCEIAASQDAVQIHKDASTYLMTHRCTVTAGAVNVNGGVYVSTDGDFNNEPPQIAVTGSARLLLTGNRFAQNADIANSSLFESKIDHNPVAGKPLPALPDVRPRETKPARNALYVVTEAPFNAVADATVTDNTLAIQSALDQAGTDGGGVVFLPPGKYRVDGNLVVPTGVELKGASDVASVPKGQGSILEVYGGKNNPGGDPFLKLSAQSGIRGLTFDYPEQLSSLAINPATLPQYPYCIQAMGADVYVVNVGVRATCYGIDLFSYPCDRHYVDYFAGHVFKNAIRVGGGSKDGVISNVQFNSIVMACGYEDPKFGAWPNSENETAAKEGVYNQNWLELEFLIMEDCEDEILYNDFHYDSHKGMTFRAANGRAPSGIMLGTAVDASMRPICFEDIDDEKGFDIVNTQVVSVAKDALYGDTKFIETAPGFTDEVTLFCSDYWGSARYGGIFGGGTVNFVLAHFQQYGSVRFLEITGDAEVHISTSDVNASSFVSSGKNGQVSVEASIVALPSPSGYLAWRNNLSTSPALVPGATLPRSGWAAQGSPNNNDARNAIDGNLGSRWSAGSQANPGQWFAVDAQQPVTFNTVILDASASPGDGPKSYAVYATNNTANWGTPIATGDGQQGATVISVPKTTARYVRVMQTGSGKTQYWSIYEFYLALLGDTGDPNPPIPTGHPTREAQNAGIYHYAGTLYFTGLEKISPDNRIDVYNVAGQRVFQGKITGNSLSIGKLSAGVYVVVFRNGDQFVREKIMTEE